MSQSVISGSQKGKKRENEGIGEWEGEEEQRHSKSPGNFSVGGGRCTNRWRCCLTLCDPQKKQLTIRAQVPPWKLEDKVLLVHLGSHKLLLSCSWNTYTTACHVTEAGGGYWSRSWNWPKLTTVYLLSLPLEPESPQDSRVPNELQINSDSAVAALVGDRFLVFLISPSSQPESSFNYLLN